MTPAQPQASDLQRSKKPYIAQYGELHGPMNPTGIIDANFLILVRALQTGDDPANVEQALYDWLGNLPPKRRVVPEQMARMLQLGPEKALQAVIQAIGGGLGKGSGEKPSANLPPKAVETLQRALAYIARKYTRTQGQAIGREIGRLRNLKRSYRAESIVAMLLR